MQCTHKTRARKGENDVHRKGNQPHRNRYCFQAMATYWNISFSAFYDAFHFLSFTFHLVLLVTSIICSQSYSSIFITFFFFCWFHHFCSVCTSPFRFTLCITYAAHCFHTWPKHTKKMWEEKHGSESRFEENIKQYYLIEIEKKNKKNFGKIPIEWKQLWFWEKKIKIDSKY